MAESVVTFVAETIGTVLIDEGKFLRGVEGKVQDLHRELRLIRCLLRDADERREQNQAVGECVAQLREFAYDAEDIIERYILRVTLNNGQNIVKAYPCFMGKCTCLQVHVVGTEIEGLKSSISNLRTSMLAFGAQPATESERKGRRASTLNRTYAHFEEDFVGREESIKELVEELKHENRQRVIFVWGMGGVGKTSLAKKVFNHNEVKNHFDDFAWACISQEYQERDILEGILVKLKPELREQAMKMRVEELSENLYKTQKEKRCLVVLDDIWTKEAWDSLRAAFPIKDPRSKLLITTRKKEVAQHISREGFFHEPQCLSYEESWDLLKKRAFPERKDVELSPGGPQVGQGIVRGQAIDGSERQFSLSKALAIYESIVVVEFK